MEQTATFVRQLLNYIPRAIPDYTDHGVQHSNNLTKIFHNFIQNLEKHFKGVELTEEEKWVICLAIWLHDIGCLLTSEENKEKHNKYSVEILERPEFHILADWLGDDILKCVEFIALSHSSNYKLRNLPTDPIHSNIRLMLVCAIFRLIDECDITSARTKKVLYELLKAYNLLDAESIKFWKAHRTISSLVFEREKIVVYSVDLNAADLLVKHLESDLQEINRGLAAEKFPTFKVKKVLMKVS